MVAIKFDSNKFDRKQSRMLSKSKKSLDKLYEAFYKEVARIGATTGFDDPERDFFLQDYPKADKAMQSLLRKLCDRITGLIEDGCQEGWSISNAKNSALINALGNIVPDRKDFINRINMRSESALNSFQDRKVNGMGLSERVWKSQQQVKGQIELALELGLAEGKSAPTLSRDVRSYLREPERLFRRVRDKKGHLRLSKSAAAYHPGQGVYRSSYKNALRMTVTENNIAYRTADFVQQQEMDFVIGIEVRLSDNHPCDDICDDLAGIYPKKFKFTGWHPFCRCYTIPKLAEREELNKWARMSKEERAGYHFKGEVRSMPKKFTDWVDRNAERIKSAKSLPYFIKDNFKDGDPRKGLQWERKKPDHVVASAKSKHETIMENAAKRHTARTSGQASDIQTRWNESRSNASIVARAKRTMRIAERFPGHSNIKLKRALEKTDYKRLAKVTAETRGYLIEWVGMERKIIEARILINTTNGIDADIRNYILHEISTKEKALRAKGRNAYGNAKDGIRSLEKELAAFKPVKTLKKDVKFIERLDAGETAEQLASRLGKDCPATIKNFAKTVNQLEADVVGEFSQEEIQVFQDTAREMFRKYDFATNTRAKYLENILDEHLKNLQETGNSGGATNVQVRINTSHGNFGTSKTVQAEEFEKYGLLAEKDVNKRVGGDWYGHTTIRWKKDNVNATFTMGDSLDDYEFIAPSLVTDPKITSIAARNGRNIKCVDLNQLKGIQQASKKGIDDMLDEMPDVHCIELQYHGQLTMDCIESVTFAEKSEARVAKKAIKKLLQKGIPCYIQNGNAKQADRITEQIFKTL